MPTDTSRKELARAFSRLRVTAVEEYQASIKSAHLWAWGWTAVGGLLGTGVIAACGWYWARNEGDYKSKFAVVTGSVFLAGGWGYYNIKLYELERRYALASQLIARSEVNRERNAKFAVQVMNTSTVSKPKK